MLTLTILVCGDNLTMRNGHTRGPAVLLLAASLVAGQAWADSGTPAMAIAGWVEKITLSAVGETLKAKLDTGARTSSIHAVDIKVFRRDEQRWVRFKVPLGTEEGERMVSLERPLTRRVRVKDHDDESDRRPVVELEFCFDGRSHRAQFSLVDRSRFIYPVLLGRRFLAGVAVVDPSRTFLTKSGCAQ